MKDELLPGGDRQYATPNGLSDPSKAATQTDKTRSSVQVLKVGVSLYWQSVRKLYLGGLVTITSLIGDVQRRYIEFFTAARDRISSSEENVAAEVLVALNNEQIPYPYRYLRVDVLSKNSDGAIKPFGLTLDPDPNFEATAFKFDRVQVAFYPFSWNKAQIVFEKAIADHQQLDRFITRWLDVEETEAHAHDSLSGAAHSFTPVESNGDWWYLTVDFGTAPAEAMIEFIEFLAYHGVTRITVKAG